MVNLQKPPRGARINWADPITKDLSFIFFLNEYSGEPYFYTKKEGLKKGELYNEAHWEKGGIATTIATGGSSSADKIICRSSSFNVTNKNFTLMVWARRLSSSGEDPNYIARVDPGSGDYYKIMCSDSDGRVRFAIQTGGGAAELWSSYYITDNEIHQFVLVRSGANTVKGYVDGRYVGIETSSASTGSIDVPDEPIGFGNSSGNSNLFKGIFYYALMFNEIDLSKNEILAIYNNPYSFLETPSSRAYFYVQAGQLITPDTADFSLTAEDAIILRDYNIILDTVDLPFTAETATVTQTHLVTTDTPEFVFSAETAFVNETTVTMNLKVVDTAGAAIEGAHVEIHRKSDNSLLFSGNTNADGEVSGSFTLGWVHGSISKAGYQTYASDMYINEDIDWQIALNKQVGIIITGCGASVNLSPANPTNVLYT